MCTSPLLHILAGLSPATLPRTTTRDGGEPYDAAGESFSQPSSRSALSGKVLLQTLLPNLRVDEENGNNHGDGGDDDDDDDDYPCERETCDEEEESPSVACTNGGDDAVRLALADMESRIIAHLDASVMSLSQKLENLLQQSFAQLFLTQQQQQQQQQSTSSNEDKETELSLTPSRLIRASPSPSLINAFQNLCSDDQSSMETLR